MKDFHVAVYPGTNVGPCLPLRVLSLCTGTGAIELGLDVVCPTMPTTFVEGEAYAAANLVSLMANGSLDPTPIWSDVRTFRAVPWAGYVDLVASGIPCTPYSRAGAAQGGQDRSDLTSELIRIVGEVQPALVFIENVVEFVRRPSRPGDGDDFPGGFHRTAEGLHRLGYRVEEPRVEPASSVGASHHRHRAFVLAWERSPHGEGVLRDVAAEIRRAQQETRQDVADAYRARLQEVWPRRNESGVKPWHHAMRRSVQLDDAVASPFAPGPESKEWGERIDLPQPGIRGVPPRSANWVDRMRLLGGVASPLATACAFAHLVSRAADSLRT